MTEEVCRLNVLPLDTGRGRFRGDGRSEAHFQWYGEHWTKAIREFQVENGGGR